MAVQHPETESTTHADDRDRQDQVACELADRQSQARCGFAEHQCQRYREPGHSYNCDKECRSSDEFARGSAHSLAALLLAWEQSEFRVTAQIEMANCAPEWSEYVSLSMQEGCSLLGVEDWLSGVGRRNCIGGLVVVFLKRGSAEELEGGCGQGVCDFERLHRGLLEDLVAGEGCGFLGVVGVLDDGLGAEDVFEFGVQ